MDTDNLTREELIVIIQAQTHLINALRVGWVMQVHEPDDKRPHRAWLALYTKPFYKNFFLLNKSILLGYDSMYDPKPDEITLISALQKANG